MARPFAADTPWTAVLAAWPVFGRQPTTADVAAIVVAWRVDRQLAIATSSSSIELVAAASFAMSAG